MENNTATKVGIMGTLGILSISMMGMGTTAVTPAMATFMAQFPGANVNLIQSLATLGVVAGSLIGGQIAGKFIGFKPLVIIGNALCIVFGILPVFIPAFGGVLAMRLLMGISLGLITPVGNALVAAHYEGQPRARMMGFNSVFMNVGGIVFQQLGGVFARQAANLTYWAHIFFVAGLVLALFLPNDKKMTKDQRLQMKAMQADRPKMNFKITIYLGIVLLVFQTVNMSVMLDISPIFEERAIGGPVLAATALTLYTVAGMVSGVVFAPFWKTLKRFTFFVGFALVAVAVVLIMIGQNLGMEFAGTIIMGFGFNLCFPGIMAWIAQANPEVAVGGSTSIVVAMMNFGGFLCAFWMVWMGNSARNICLADIIVSAVLAVLCIFVHPFGKRNQQNQQPPEAPAPDAEA